MRLSWQRGQECLEKGRMASTGFANGAETALGLLSSPVRDWFFDTFPGGPTPAQMLAWPPIAAGDNVLLVAPTGTGKTLAAFLAIIDGLCRAHAAGELAPGLRCVYVSPLRSLNYDIERNLCVPLEGIRDRLNCATARCAWACAPAIHRPTSAKS